MIYDPEDHDPGIHRTAQMEVLARAQPSLLRDRLEADPERFRDLTADLLPSVPEGSFMPALNSWAAVLILYPPDEAA